jgi:hypothetical protein
MTPPAAEDAALISGPVIGAIIAGAVALVVLAVNAITSAVSQRRTRRRDAFSEAFASCVTYAELPYVIRRRDPADEATERLRISSELRRVQEDIAYYRVWLRGESSAVADAYDKLVADTRAVAGKAMHDAWLQPGVSSDAGMNMPDLGLGQLEAPRAAYIAQVRKALEPVRGAFRKDPAP